MDELELRIAALELVLIEVFAWIDPLALEDATHSLRASVQGCGAEERAVRLSALELIADARGRFAGVRA
jgi:hypothetical protein